MDTNEIIEAINQQIQRLETAKALLMAGSGKSGPATAATPRRKISAAGRRRIAAAQKARWARVKKAGK
jgi:hypothetical protein